MSAGRSEISRAERIRALVAASAADKGRGLTTAEIRAAWDSTAEAPAPATLTAEIGSLVRRGELVRCGGRVGHHQYAPKGFVPSGDAVPQADDVELILQACTSAVARLDRPVTTREVQMELTALGLVLAKRYANAVRRGLLTLARPRRRGPTPGASRIRWIEGGPPGCSTSLWIPVASPAASTAPAVPRSASEALRWAIEGAVRMFGRPIRRHELELWLQAAPEGRTLRPWLPLRRLAPLLAAVRKTDRHSRRQFRVRAITTPWTAYGGAPVRYTLTAPTSLELAVVRLEDTLWGTRFAEELETLGYLRARATIMQSASLLDWIRHRMITTTVVLDDARGEQAEAVVHDCARRALVMAQTLGAAARGVAVRRFIARWARDLSALNEFTPAVTEQRPPHLPVTASRLSEPELQWWAQTARHQLGLGARTWTSLLAEVRRVALPSPGRARIASERPLPLSACDRVEFFQRLYGAVELPKTRSLIADALLLLGPMCRDTVLLERWRRRHVRESWEWQTATLALALLGVRALDGRPARTVSEELALVLTAGLCPLQPADFDDPVRAALVLGRVSAGLPLGAVE